MFCNIQEKFINQGLGTTATPARPALDDEDCTLVEENVDCLDEHDTQVEGLTCCLFLVKSINKRWTSMYHCLQRLLLLNQFVKESTQWVLTNKQGAEESGKGAPCNWELLASEWFKLGKLADLLKQFMVTTKALEAIKQHTHAQKGIFPTLFSRSLTSWQVVSQPQITVLASLHWVQRWW